MAPPTSSSSVSLGAATTAAPSAQKPRAFARLSTWQPTLSQETLILVASAFFAVVSNGPFWSAAHALHPGSMLFLVALSGVLIAANGLLLSLLVWRWTAKPVLTVLLFVTAMAVHYMTRYGVYFDADMVRNVLATDVKESRELMTPSLILPVLFTAALPALLLWRVRIAPRAFTRTLWVRPVFMVALVVFGAGSVMLASADVASMLRNHREIKYLATPMNYVIGLKQNLRSSSPIAKAPKTPIAQDAVAAARPEVDRACWWSWWAKPCARRTGA